MFPPAGFFLCDPPHRVYDLGYDIWTTTWNLQGYWLVSCIGVHNRLRELRSYVLDLPYVWLPTPRRTRQLVLE